MLMQAFLPAGQLGILGQPALAKTTTEATVKRAAKKFISSLHKHIFNKIKYLEILTQCVFLTFAWLL
jgi:hypothetical protein